MRTFVDACRWPGYGVEKSTYYSFIVIWLYFMVDPDLICLAFLGLILTISIFMATLFNEKIIDQVKSYLKHFVCYSLAFQGN